jgi:membrane associated rhomboid family serine protease
VTGLRPPEPPEDDEPDPRPADEPPSRGRSEGPSGSWRLTTPDVAAPDPDLERDGPLSREAALRLLDRGKQLMDSADFGDAARHYQRVIGFDDLAVTSAGLLGLGNALHRLDRDADALGVWEQVTEMPDTPSTYPAWRNVAAARVRAGDNRGALDAYREADRRAPAEDKGEIASRLGWLSKEIGDTRTAGRYFARARGADGIAFSFVIIGMTVVVSLLADPSFSPEGSFLGDQLRLDKAAIANGDWWRLFTVALVHAPLLQMPLHLVFNMYFLWIAGPIVEQLYGRLAFVAIYVVSALGGSVASYAFGEGQLGVGASGAIFGLFGILLVASRRHHPVLDRQGRMFVGQLGGLIVINLIIGFALADIIDNFGHLGGLAVGAWLGFLIPPGRVPTLRTMWQRTSGETSMLELVARLVGIVAMVAVLVAGYAIGTQKWG